MSATEPTRRERRALEAENLAWPVQLRQVPRDDWPMRMWAAIPAERHPVEVWRSRDYLLTVYRDRGYERLSVCRTAHDGHRWLENITWDDLQRLKSECGRGARDAVEVYPADHDVVNVANMRHLWVMPEPLPFAWRKIQPPTRSPA